MRLHLDPRSSASLRVSCLAAYKHLDIDTRTVGLLQGDHLHADFGDINPAHAVPVLELGIGQVVTQSMAIMEYLEERHPAPPALPANALERAHVRALCGLIGSDIHPLTNMKVRQWLAQQPGGSDLAQSWCRHWTQQGLQAFAQLAATSSSRYCMGNTLTFADFFLVPQMLNARRFGCDESAYGRLVDIDRRCRELPAFAAVNAMS